MDRKLVYANRYFLEHFGWDQESLTDASIMHIFTPASQIFCDSYVFPRVMAEPVCSEVQLTVLTSGGERRPVVASVQRLSNGDFAWVLMEADNRNNLFQELEAARDILQHRSSHLEHLSRTDTLTGLLNRRGFENAVEKVFEEANLHGTPIAVLLIDLDDFKSINDEQGHAVGDEVLTILAGILKASCREQDLVGRLGGDEFACVLPRTTMEGARKLCSRIHAAVAENSTTPSSFTVSIGAVGPGAQEPIEWPRAFQEADRALYDAKSAGRQTTVFRETGPDGSDEFEHP